MDPSFKKLSTVQLLIELESKTPTYSAEIVKAEIKSRNHSEEELKKFNSQKEYVLNKRQKKEEASLSIPYILFLIFIPFYLTGSKFGGNSHAQAEYEAFYSKAGYKKKAKQILRFRLIGAGLWVSAFVGYALYNYFK